MQRGLRPTPHAIDALAKGAHTGTVGTDLGADVTHRTTALLVKLSPDELARLHAAAAAELLPTATWARRVLLARAAEISEGRG